MGQEKNKDMYNKPYLEPYKGKATRHECPNCGDKHSFAYYLDGETGEIINRTVGRCNHESGCGYHYTPKQFFADNPTENERSSKAAKLPIKTIPKPQREIGTIPFRCVEKSASYNSNFIYFLCGLVDIPTLERLMEDYALGATKDGDVIFWQIDTQGRVRTGKVMKYDKKTGHRIKEGYGLNWVHSLMKNKGQLPEDYNLKQCLFGEHLLRMYPDRIVALVESEKSALIASALYPQYIWMATGGKSQLSTDKLMVLQGRTVIMFPDVDGFNEWTEKAKEIQSIGCKVMVSDVLEKNATDEERARKIDIADWLIRFLVEKGQNTTERELTEAERTLQAMIKKNATLQLFIDAFDLELIV